jgi:LuxR family quorum-sensing system transcriptional regulator SolR
MEWHWEDIQITVCAKDLGFDYCCYGIRVPVPVSKPAVAIFDTYPDGWMKHYKECGFLAIDPTVRQGMRTADLIVWSEAAFASAPRLWSDALDHGLTVGAAQSCWGAHGVFGLLTLSRRAKPLTLLELERLTKQSSWLANLSHARMSQFLVPKLAPETRVVLATAKPRVRLARSWAFLSVP